MSICVPMSIVFTRSTSSPLVSSAFLLTKAVVAAMGVHLNEVKYFAKKLGLEVGTPGVWYLCGVRKVQTRCDFCVLGWPPPSQVSAEWGPDCN